MIKILILSLWACILTQCGTEVGNHAKDPDKEEVASGFPTDPDGNVGDIPSNEVDEFYPEHAFLLDCGSVFDENIDSPLSLISSDHEFWSATFINETWEVNYSDNRSYTISKDTNTNLIVVNDNNANEIENQFVCETEKDLTGTGDSQEKTKFITANYQGETYRASWTVNETTSPHKLIKMQLLRVSDDTIIIEWE